MKWKTIDFIDGFENLYEVSDTGIIRRIDSQRELKTHPDKDGYLRLNLSKNGKKKNFAVHRLVAMAFIPNSESKPQVDHIDTDLKNNSVSNLRWATPYENIHNPITESKVMNNKFHDFQYRDEILELRKLDYSYKKISQILGCTKSTVHYHIKGNGHKNNS